MTGNLFFRKDKSVSADFVHGYLLGVDFYSPPCPDSYRRDTPPVHEGKLFISSKIININFSQFLVFSLLSNPT